MNFHDHEARVNGALFSRLGVDADIHDQQGNLLVAGTRIIFDQGVQVRDDNGMITETRCEAGLPANLNPQRGWGITLLTPATQWELMKKLEDDGFESRWIAVPAKPLP